MNVFFKTVSALVRAWTWLYTLGAGPERRDRRREEIASDLWESAQEMRLEGGRTQALDDLRRLLRGIPDDLMWRFERTPEFEATDRGRRFSWLEDLVPDLRLGLRAMWRNPLFTGVAVVTLALGIGANTAIFSIADAVLFRSLPVSSPEELVVLRQRGPAGDVFPFHSAAVADLSANQAVLSGLAAFRPNLNTIVSVGGESDLVLTQSVSASYHRVVGVHAMMGRTLTEQDREPVVVISHGYWQRRFGGDPNVIGRTLEVQNARQAQPRSFTIVGVTPPEFFGTQPGRHVDITAPLTAQTMNMPREARWLYLIGRLAPGVSREQARTALRQRWSQLAEAGSLPSLPAVGLELEVDSGAQGLNELRREFALPLHILMAAVGVVLLVACANVAGLLIVRSSGRQQEIAIRRSLGAGRGRIVRQLLTESAVLAVAGGAAAVALAFSATNLLIAMMSRGRGSVTLDVGPNVRVLAFAAVVTVITAALFGLLPAVGATRIVANTVVRRNTWGRAMVATQVALLVLLLTSAGLFTRTLQKLRSVDAGFRQDGVLFVRVPPTPGYPRDRMRGLYEDLSERFGALPGVQSISMAMDTPPANELSMCAALEIPGRPARAEDPPVCRNSVGPRFFETMGIPVLAGRDFARSDDERGPQYVAISEGVARRFFAGEEALGRQLVLNGPANGRVEASIVGIVKDVRYTSLRVDAPLMIYRPYRQESGLSASTFLIHSSSVPGEALAPMLRAEVRAVAPAFPPPSVVSLEDVIAGALVEERMLAALSTVIGAMAAILAAIGIYSIVAATVARRQREIGIRMALGAQPGQVAGMATGEAFRIVAVGLAIGLPTAVVAAVATRAVLAGVLFDLSPTEPLILLGSVAAILAIASIAAFAPVRRASRIDPVKAIRSE